MAPRPVLTEEEQTRIAEAVARAETVTAAEIRVAVITTPLVVHTHHATLWAALIALVLPWPVLFLVPMPALWLLAVQAGLFILACGLLSLPPLVHRLALRRDKQVAAQTLARQLFLAHGVHQTEARTGLLILVAPEDRLVEVVADVGIHQALGEGAWRHICDSISTQAGAGRLAEGIVEGVRLSGDMLAGPVPARPGDRNEVPDRVVLL